GKKSFPGILKVKRNKEGVPVIYPSDGTIDKDDLLEVRNKLFHFDDIVSEFEFILSTLYCIVLSSLPFHGSKISFRPRLISSIVVAYFYSCATLSSSVIEFL